MKPALPAISVWAFILLTATLSFTKLHAQSSRSLLLNHGASCGSFAAEDHFFSDALSAAPGLSLSCNLGIPYGNVYAAYNPADHKIYYADIQGGITKVYPLNFNLGGNINCPAVTAPDYVYGYTLQQLCFDNSGNNYGFFAFDFNSGTAHMAKVDITTGAQMPGTDKLVEFPANDKPNTVGDGDIVITPNGRMFVTFGSAPSKLYEFTNLTGSSGNIKANFLANLPRPCFSIAFIDGDIMVAGSDGLGCYYYVWDINSYSLSNASSFPLGKTTADMSNLTIGVGSTKQLTGANIINSNTAILYYQIVIKNKGNIILNNLQASDNLAQLFGAGNISNVHITVVDNPSNLQINPAYNGETDTRLLIPNQVLSNFPVEKDSIVINMELTATNLVPNFMYKSSVITTGDIGAGANYLNVSDSSNNGNASKMDIDGNGLSDDNGENVPTPFIFAPGVLSVTDVSLQGWKSNGAVKLDWKDAASQMGNDFEIQRSLDGIHYQTIGMAQPPRQAHYNFTDDITSLVSPTVFYRIKANRTRTDVIYSNTLFIKNNGQVSIAAFPNPFTDIMNLQVQSDQKNAGSISVRDITGRLLITQPLQLQKGTNYVTIKEVQKLVAGTYVVEIISGYDKANLKVMKR